jgi:uncharacterized membrane protein YvbJ
MQLCPTCHTKNSDATNFCKKCGHKFGIRVKHDNPDTSQDDPLHRTHDSPLYGKWKW